MTMPPVAPLSAERLALEMAMFLNGHHLDSLNLLCALAGSATHPVCEGNTASAEYAASLLGGAVPDDSVWEHAGGYPHLHEPAARQLRQAHFEDISKALWAAYKNSVISA